jgi:hypothetical protein
VSRLALLPLDDRPVNYDQPWWLGRAAGIEVVRPPREWLGGPLRPAARDRLADWLQDEGQSADGVVVAVDTLAYGGLIPSRQSETPLADVAAALEPLRAIREARPTSLILAFSVLMRVSRSNSAEEEKPYWADHGANLFRLSYLDDKVDCDDADEGEASERTALAAAVPAGIVAAYRAGRARNHAVNRIVLDQLEEGIVDYALIAQDDTATYGWNIAEARVLRELIRARSLADRATVYPGADDVASLLVAAFACRQAGFRPRVWPRYSGLDGAGSVTAYEDRPFEELVKAHLGPLGGTLAAGPEDADLILAVNAPGEAQAEAWLQLAIREPELVAAQPAGALDGAALRAVRREVATVRRNVDEFTRAVAGEVAGGRDVAVVDVAFVNGADLALAESLLAHVPLARLAAYAAWNTAGNSLGSALAHGVVRVLARRERQPPEAVAAHVALLFMHFLDDYAFQGLVRSELLLKDFPELGLAPTFERLPDELLPVVLERLRRRLAPHVESLARAFALAPVANGPTECQVTSIAIEDPTLPWERVFELAVTPLVELA